MKLRALRYTLLLSILFGISFLLRASLPSVATGTWVAAGSMSAARSGACTVALNDGRLLVAGGTTSGGGITNSAEIYDPSADSWRHGFRDWRGWPQPDSAAVLYLRHGPDSRGPDALHRQLQLCG